MLQFLDLTAQHAHLVLRCLDALGQIEQTLIGQHALDAKQPIVQLVELLHGWIRLRRRGGAACQNGQQAKRERGPQNGDHRVGTSSTRRFLEYADSSLPCTAGRSSP